MPWRWLPRGDQLSPSVRRWLWFVGLWLAGVAATTMVGLVIKFWLS